jgi:hypothetical protein
MPSSIGTRKNCPFYGFNSALMDTKGNGCFWAGDHTPCKMEMNELRPNWENCLYKESEQTKRNLPELLATGRIFSQELKPMRADEWDGISFYYWYHYITSGTPLFPEQK